MNCPEKAQLEVLDDSGEATGDPIPVQFNPNTMSIEMANEIDGNENSGRQARRYTGTSSATLSVDLEFDTADLGTSDEPVDVRSLTSKVAQFVLPGGDDAQKAPPRLRFCWGTFELSGVMTTLSEELSLFSPQGVPLRSRLSVKIKEQDPKYVALESGSGAPSSGANERAAEAQENETPADFLARNGLAPAAWRALGGALDALGDGVELPIGLAIPFPSAISLGGGVALTAGFQAGLDVSVQASLGLELAGAASSGSSANDGGLALAAAGGLTAASETAKTATADDAAAAARSDFGQASPGSEAGAQTSSSRKPLATQDSARTLGPNIASAAPPPPRSDPRSTSFGRGVPLRDRVTVTGSQQDSWVVIGHRPPTEPAATAAGRGAPWVSLPASAARSAADAEQHRRSPACGCHRCNDPRARRRKN